VCGTATGGFNGNQGDDPFQTEVTIKPHFYGVLTALHQRGVLSMDGLKDIFL